MSCAKNEIKRNAYTRKDGTKVKATCIANRGLPGKSNKKIEIKNEGVLSNAGYDDIKNMNENQRHRALNKAIKEHGHLKIIRALGARRALLYRTEPNQSNIFGKDQKWVSAKYKLYKEENK